MPKPKTPEVVKEGPFLFGPEDIKTLSRLTPAINNLERMQERRVQLLREMGSYKAQLEALDQEIRQQEDTLLAEMRASGQIVLTRCKQRQERDRRVGESHFSPSNEGLEVQRDG